MINIVIIIIFIIKYTSNNHFIKCLKYVEAYIKHFVNTKYLDIHLDIYQKKYYSFKNNKITTLRFEFKHKVVEKRWPWLTMVEDSWPWLNTVDHGRPKLAIVPHGWACLTIVEKGWIWLGMANHGRRWLTMVEHGWPWMTMIGHA